MPPNMFTDQELLVIDVALTELAWALEEELDYLEDDDPNLDSEYDKVLEQLTIAEDLITELHDVMDTEVNEYV